jgi:hypothetical protein
MPTTKYFVRQPRVLDVWCVLITQQAEGIWIGSVVYHERSMVSSNEVTLAVQYEVRASMNEQELKENLSEFIVEKWQLKETPEFVEVTLS